MEAREIEKKLYEFRKTPEYKHAILVATKGKMGLHESIAETEETVKVLDDFIGVIQKLIKETDKIIKDSFKPKKERREAVSVKTLLELELIDLDEYITWLIGWGKHIS